MVARQILTESKLARLAGDTTSKSNDVCGGGAVVLCHDSFVERVSDLVQLIQTGATPKRIKALAVEIPTIIGFVTMGFWVGYQRWNDTIGNYDMPSTTVMHANDTVTRQTNQQPPTSDIETIRRDIKPAHEIWLEYKKLKSETDAPAKYKNNPSS